VHFLSMSICSSYCAKAYKLRTLVFMKFD